MSYCVYKHTSPTGKAYIGVANANPLKRWQNGNGYKNQPLFYLAIKLYGWDNLTHEILIQDIPSLAEVNKLEKEYIGKYNTFWNGYNMRPQTGGNFIFKDRVFWQPSCELFWSILRYHHFKSAGKNPQYPSAEELIKEFNLVSGYEVDAIIEQAYQAMIMERPELIDMR